MGCACNRKGSAGRASRLASLPPSNRLLGAGLDSALTQRPQQATITHHDPHARATAGTALRAQALRGFTPTCGPSAGSGRGCGSLAGRWPPSTPAGGGRGSPPDPDWSGAGPALGPAPGAGPHAAQAGPLTESREGHGGARGARVVRAFLRNAGPDDAPGSGGCGGAGVRVAPRAVVQPPSPSSRALAHTPPGMVGSARVFRAPACGLGTGVWQKRRHSWADGLGLTLL